MIKENINNRFVIDDMIFLTNEQYTRYINSEVIGNKNITIDLLIDFLDNDYFYGYVLDLFNERIKCLSIVYVDMHGNRQINKYYKMDVLKALSDSILNNKLELTEKITNRFEKLIQNISYDAFKKKYINDDYVCMIDNKKVTIPLNLIFVFLECSEEEYNRFFNIESEDKIIGIPKEYFAYALIKFFRSNNVLDKYYIPENILSRYKELLDSRKIDLEAINKINETYNVNSKNIILNSEFEDYILGNIPDGLDKLEKAIYIYLELCDLLTYDEEFYALGSQGNILNKKHENIKRLESISLSNNGVICYEFNAIYSKFLDKISVNYETNASYSDIFGGGHEDLVFKYGKYLVKADSTLTTIIYSDIVNVKLGKPLNGLICQNINEKTKEKFQKKLDYVYKIYISKKMNSINFDELIVKYNKVKNNKNMSLNDKFNCLIDELNKSNLTGVDLVSYAHQLSKIIFDPDELLNNFTFTIVRCKYKEINLCSVFTLNNEYYMYIPRKIFAKITKEVLEDLFECGNMEYTDDEHIIPGININESVMKLTKN